MTISWEAGLLLALLATALLLQLSLLLCAHWQGREAIRAAALEREVATMLAEWSARDPAPRELEWISGLDRPDRRVVLAFMARALPDTDAFAAARAREALRRSGLLALELARLRHRSAGVRADACRIVGRLGVRDAVPVLVERLEDADRAVRHEAVGALGDLHAVDALGEVVQAIEDAGDWGNLLAIMALVRMGKGSVARIGALLRASRAPTTIKALLQVSGQLGVAADPEWIRALAAHEDPEVRVEALRVLGALDSMPESVVTCLRALDDAEWPPRALAAASLGRLGDTVAVPRLRQAMGDPAYWVRHHVAEALAALGQPGEDALRGAVEDPNPFVRDMAAQALYMRAARAEAA